MANNYPIEAITVHCSATKPAQDIGADEIRTWHVQGNGWSDIGYHFVVKRNGAVETGRPISKRGAHVKGHNAGNIGICLVGGLDDDGKPKDNFTDDQWRSLYTLVSNLTMEFPDADVLGHRDWPNVKKDCPCTDIKQWYTDNFI